ncbi:AI-2E family transporter [Heyndrickxia ginsengihumi]|uniref:AI-2E family transporter n=1 Tax=Heyndrickxia ginsengihumi TaxID=363870 RepID=UPI003D2079F6
MGDQLFSFFQKKETKRVIIFILMAFILYLLKSIIDLILLTFIFSYLMNRLEKIVTKRIPLNRKLTVIILYILIVGLLTFGITRYLPVLIDEITELVKQIVSFYTRPQHNVVLNYIVEYIQDKKITDYVQKGFTVLVSYFSTISQVSLQVFMSFLLSLFFLLEKERIIRFTKQFKHSKLASFYEELEYFGQKFVGTFGKVIEAQFIIAFVNAILSAIGLSILGFPQLLGLVLMIFCLGLIPVAGVIISLIPLCLIAYSIGGAIEIVYVLILVAIIHSIETYVLNPKLMSSKTNLPVFYTFLILIFSEHFFGVWGLILGIPVIVFFLDVLEVTNHHHSNKINH